VSRGSVQSFSKRTGKGRRGWARHNGGRRGWDKAGARAQRRRRVVTRPSGIDGRVARARRAWVDLGQGRMIWPRAGRGLSGRCPLAQLVGRHQRSGGRRPLPLDGTEQGREKKREGGRRKRAAIQIKFSQNFKQKLEKL
jgi:hypothetical protein